MFVDRTAAQLEIDLDVVADRRSRSQGVDVRRVGVDRLDKIIDIVLVA